MADNRTDRLIFWPFFKRLEREFSYERWIDKYRIFLKTLAKGYIPYDDEFNSFRQFCKILYLQDHRHEIRFDELLTEYIELEKKALIDLLIATQTSQKREKKDQKTTLVEDDISEGNTKGWEQENEGKDDVNDEEKTADYEEETEIKYFHPDIGEITGAQDADPGILITAEKYLHTDEYFPASRREMVKAWQYLRRMEKSGVGDKPDLPATVKKVAQEGIFLDPVYQARFANRQDTLLILADSRGSMTPFNELTQRLIHTALNEGRHRRAPVFYYHNFPKGSLYRQPNLTEPIGIGEALQKSSQHSTYAFIISDAGAARGSSDESRISLRFEATMEFVEVLQQKTAHIIWLNPMPRHRWRGTPAEMIAEKVSAMIPVIEQEEYNFQDVLRRCIKFKGNKI